jgi:hypothetical protein
MRIMIHGDLHVGMVKLREYRCIKHERDDDHIRSDSDLPWLCTWVLNDVLRKEEHIYEYL